MRRLRFWTAVLSVWLIFFFNIERILLTVEVNLIQSYTYIFVALMLVVVLLSPQMRQTVFAGLVGLSASVFLIVWYHQPLLRKMPALAISDVSVITLLTLIQVSAIILTSLLARQVSRALREFEEVIARITYNHLGARPKPFIEAQSDMYRELKRARYYQRPLSVVALSVDEASLQAHLPAIVEEVQQALMKEFALAKMGRILDAKLHHFNPIALRDNCFIVILPEMDKAAALDTARHLGQALADKMPVRLRLGGASFPEDAITFEKLVEQAIDSLRPSERLKAEAQSSTSGAALPMPKRPVVREA